jgi:polyferredoxin/tetratricopeptide (TPR) repeat protein
MKSGCESENPGKKKRSIVLPVLKNQKPEFAHSKNARWRALSLIVLQLLMIAHIIQWRINGSTVTPIEPSEAMFTLQNGAVNAGFIFFTLAILATLIFGRFVCGWGCHIVALQDFCAWLLRKMGLTPKPFGSRLLMFVPLIVALYMFVWPVVARWLVKPASEPLIPEFTNHIITTEFWVTFPPVLVAIPFLFICGFMTVYFLGQKGFCTYACPYGGFFAIADKVAPGKIRVTDACNQCGLCTATCMANVQVHKEIKDYGMVIDPGCMKHMDCISVCPNDALYFGFGKPSILAKTNESPKSQVQSPKSQLTWPEEIAFVLVFALSYFAVWDVYQLIPMLMSLGIACVTTFLAYKTYKIATEPNVSFYKYTLRSSTGRNASVNEREYSLPATMRGPGDEYPRFLTVAFRPGSIKTAGWVFVTFAALWIGLNVHSGFIRYHERAGTIAYESVTIPDELALANADVSQWQSGNDRQNIADGRKHLETADRYGIFLNEYAMPKHAWLEYLGGNPEKALELLKAASEHQTGQPKALSFYYRGAILNRLGRYEEAIADLDAALKERGDLATAREEKGLSYWQLGQKEQAVAIWKDATGGNASVNDRGIVLPLTYNYLAGAMEMLNKPDEAAQYQQLANRSTPNDPYFHWAVGLRLQDANMNDLAEKHFARAIQLNSSFILRRKAN